jgi:hypothetical protein
MHLFGCRNQVSPLKDNETQVQTGFVEIHGYDTKLRKRRKVGGKNNFLFRPSTLNPASHSQQKLFFTWEQILRVKTADLKLEDIDPPVLRLDGLREFI